MHCPATDKPATVLIIDDEPGVRESLRTVLSGEFAVHTAATEAEALALIGSVPVDVVTLDLRMPGIGGMGLLERIKEHDQDIEVLIITGCGSIDSAINSIRLRAFDYVSKPFDIQHVRQLVRRAAEHRRTVRRAYLARQALFSNLNDTLRAPLNMIVGCTERLRTDACGSLTDEGRGILDQICRNSSSLLAQLEKIFFLSDLEAGELSLLPEQVRLADLFKIICEDRQRAAAEKGLSLTADSPPDLAVETDRRLLTRLLEEIVDNAIKFTESGEVSVSARPADAASVTISIQDTGVGIDPESVWAATRAHNAGPRPSQLGVALGLPTAAAISRCLQVRFDITAEPNRGTECRLTLPIRVAASETRTPSDAARIST